MRKAASSSTIGNLFKQYRYIHNKSLSGRSDSQGTAQVGASIAGGHLEDGSNSSSGKQTSWSLPWMLASAAGIAALGTSYAWQEQLAIGGAEPSDRRQRSCLEVEWVQQIAADAESALVLSASTMHNHPLLKKDHLFSELHDKDMVEDLVCFYNAPAKRLDYVIQLGKNICGFPKIVHGGLTAAVIDESFGFLWLSLRANKQLPFVGPAFTAHLEVDYKQKIPAGKLLLCKTEVESCKNRKLWMRATVCDGDSGKVYAVAKALFVCPRARKLIQEGMRYAYNQVFS